MENLKLFISLAALAISVIALVMTRQVASRDAISKQLLEGYSARSFRTIDTVHIEREEVKSLRRAKTFAKIAKAKDPNEWAKASSIKNYQAWENRVAFELCENLNDLGTSTIIGSLSLREVLAVSASAIIDDWLVSKAWTDSYRAEQKTLSRLDVGARIPFHRRHAEWIALAAALWCERQWTYEPALELIRDYGGRDGAMAHLGALTRADSGMIPLSVLWSLWRYTGVGLSSY